jgi:hypothetical protein
MAHPSVHIALTKTPIDQLIRYLETGKRLDGERPLDESWKQAIRDEIIRRCTANLYTTPM